MAAACVLAGLCHGQDTCPLRILKVDPKVTESWGRVGRTLATSGTSKTGKDLPPDFVIRVENASNKDIRGAKFVAAFYDATEDLHIVPVAWNANKSIKAGEAKNLTWESRLYAEKAAVGWLVVPQKILYEDGTAWKLSGELGTCFGEYWKDKKHPRLTKLPGELLKETSPKAEESAAQR